MSRVSEAKLLLTRFFERRVRLRRGPVALSTDGVPEALAGGVLDSLELRDGRLYLEGRSPAPQLRLRGRAETRLLRPAGDAGGFSTDLLYTPWLRVELWTGERWREVAAPTLVGPGALALAGLRGVGLLIPFFLRNLPAILAYFSRGDLAAAHLLTELLNPKDHADPWPRARTVPEHPSPERAPDGAGAPADGPVTGIVPVHNAFEITRDCLARVLAHSDIAHRVILVEDGSTDPRVRPWCEAFAAAHGDRVELILPERNLGFVGAVNLAFARLAEVDFPGHAVLLNSDALVPEAWLSRIIAPIAADPAIASVTPMSNDAEIFGAPVICTPNPLAPGMADRIDRVARRRDPARARADAPTGVGFCMALNAAFLRRIPGFDTAFGRGYGEEVDWCQRAEALGGRNLGIGTLYVEHRAGQSFGAEKAARMSQAGAIINARYPEYDQRVQAFIRSDPLIGTRLALALAALAEGEVPVYLGHIRGGGAELYLQERVAAARAAGGGAVVIRDDVAADGYLLEVTGAAGVTGGTFDSLAEILDLLALLPRRRLIYSCMVGARDVLGALAAFRAVGGWTGITLLTHDYYPLCPGHTLMDHRRIYCALPEPAACEACYGRLDLLTETRPASVAAWRAGWAEVYGAADEIVVFSQDSADKLTRIFPETAGRLRIAPHTLPFVPPPLPRPAAPPRVIGVLGAIGHNKGGAVLQALAEANRDPDLRFVVIGELDPQFHHARINVHGRYPRTGWPEIAAGYGVSAWLIPSIGPETFSYTTHEVLATGLPVCAFDLGAQRDAVAAAPNGHILGPATLPAPRILAALAAVLASGPDPT